LAGIVDPVAETVDMQTLEGDRYAIAGQLGRDAVLRSQVLPEFELALSAIFPDNAAVSTGPTKEDETSTNDND
jgi:hypothetical protein